MTTEIPARVEQYHQLANIPSIEDVFGDVEGLRVLMTSFAEEEKIRGELIELDNQIKQDIFNTGGVRGGVIRRYSNPSLDLRIVRIRRKNLLERLSRDNTARILPIGDTFMKLLFDRNRYAFNVGSLESQYGEPVYPRLFTKIGDQQLLMTSHGKTRFDAFWGTKSIWEASLVSSTYPMTLFKITHENDVKAGTPLDITRHGDSSLLRAGSLYLRIFSAMLAQQDKKADS